jgi:Ser/Thr protein kinase RdoA (MazF antagonist)
MSEATKDLDRVERVVNGYRRHVALEPEELSRLPAAIRSRPIVQESWRSCIDRQPFAAAARMAAEWRERSEAIADVARRTLAG